MGSSLIVDKLWRCMCSSIDAAAVVRRIRSSSHATAARLARASPSVSGSALGLRRARAAAETRLVHTLLSGAQLRESPIDFVEALLAARPPYDQVLAAAPTAAIYAAVQRLQLVRHGHQRIQAYTRHLLHERHEAPTPALLEAYVRANCHPSGSAEAVADMLHVVGGSDGTAAGAAAPTAGTPALFHAALAVLAVHPDYLLRNAVLAAMRARWIDLTSVGRQNVALGLLRDGQYERALDALEGMATGSGDVAETTPERKELPVNSGVPSWLYDIFTHVLAQQGFLDAALTIVNHRLLQEERRPDVDDAESAGKDMDGHGLELAAWSSSPAASTGNPTRATAAAVISTVSPNIWYALLDACCRRGDYEGIIYVWQRAVRPVAAPTGTTNTSATTTTTASTPRLVTPSDGMALDVLNAAARHGDTALAAEVLQLLTARSTKLGLAHLEAMVDCYARANAVDHALQALCIMDEAGVVLDAGSTRALYARLIENAAPVDGNDNGNGNADANAAVDRAVAALFTLRSTYGRVPVAAFNAVLEAVVHTTSDASNASDASAAALDLYRHVRQLCPAGPNRDTFELLLRRCTDVQHLNFLAGEMRAFGVPRDPALVDRLVRANAQHGSLDVALQHLQVLMGDGGGSDSGDEIDYSNREGDDDTGDIVRLPLRPWISRHTAEALVRRCVAEQDNRILAVAEASRTRGRPLDALLREALRERGQVSGNMVDEGVFGESTMSGCAGIKSGR